MFSNNLDNQPRPRSSASQASKSLPRLSLNLHTMPSTEKGHWTKWFILGASVLVVVALAAYFIFSQ